MLGFVWAKKTLGNIENMTSAWDCYPWHMLSIFKDKGRVKAYLEKSF